MQRFVWLEWNLRKVDAHGLSAEEVEDAFDRVITTKGRRDDSFLTVAELPSGRQIHIIWRYDLEDDEIPDIFGDPSEPAVFVITAY